MNIIDKTAPDIESGDILGSLQAFRNYIVETMETIDYTLANQKNRITGAVSEENFMQLAAIVQSVASNQTALSASVLELAQQVEELTDAQASIEQAQQELDVRLTELESRVSALEGQ